MYIFLHSDETFSWRFDTIILCVFTAWPCRSTSMGPTSLTQRTYLLPPQKHCSPLPFPFIISTFDDYNAVLLSQPNKNHPKNKTPICPEFHPLPFIILHLTRCQVLRYKHPQDYQDHATDLDLDCLHILWKCIMCLIIIVMRMNLGLSKHLNPGALTNLNPCYCDFSSSSGVFSTSTPCVLSVRSRGSSGTINKWNYSDVCSWVFLKVKGKGL